MPQSSQPITLDYGRATHVSRLAKIAMWLSILSIPLFFLVVPAVIALIVAWLAGHRIRNRPDLLAGLGFVKLADACALVSVALFLVSLGLNPFGHRRPRELSNRSYCAASLRGITQSMAIYAADNSGLFPILPYAPYDPALNTPAGRPVAATADDTIKSMYAAGNSLHGSPSAGPWLLALRNQASTKQFICKSDNWATRSAALQNPAGQFFDNFQSSEHLSYSFAYPWQHDGTVGKWWTDIADSSLPIASDMAPEQGTGTPARNINPATQPADKKTWNSGNHNGDGQNVAYSDVHVEWVRQPTVGQNNDNIFTLSDAISIAPREFGGIPINKTPIQLHSTSSPFDIVMVPVRNESTGKL